MSWETKTDYCGLGIANAIMCKVSSDGKTGQYLEKIGENGAIVATRAFGIVGNPSNEYTIVASHSYAANAIKLGSVVAQESKKYALAGVHYKKVAGAEPTLSAESVQIEDGAAVSGFAYFGLPAFAVSPEEIAEDAMDSFTLTGADCALIECGFDATAEVKPHNVNGYPVASGISAGKIVVSASIGQYGSVAPTLVAKSGWEVSSPLACDDPDSDFPTWKVSLTKPLTKTAQSSQSAG